VSPLLTIQSSEEQTGSAAPTLLCQHADLRGSMLWLLYSGGTRFPRTSKIRCLLVAKKKRHRCP